jgi:hypothetical protein
MDGWMDVRGLWRVKTPPWVYTSDTHCLSIYTSVPLHRPFPFPFSFIIAIPSYPGCPVYGIKIAVKSRKRISTYLTCNVKVSPIEVLSIDTVSRYTPPIISSRFYRRLRLSYSYALDEEPELPCSAAPKYSLQLHSSGPSTTVRLPCHRTAPHHSPTSPQSSTTRLPQVQYSP